MVLLLAAAILAPSHPAVAPPRASVQAQATVRIVRGAEVRFGRLQTYGSKLRTTQVRNHRNAAEDPIKIIEFE
jgi:hypothetical protein